MRKSVASFAHTFVAALMAAALMSSMVPLAWADDGPAGTVAGTVAGSAAEGSKSLEDAAATEGTDAQAPAAETRSADAKAAASTGDAATGTTIKIAVYRSSYPLVWDLNDAGAPDATKAKWDNKPEKWPTEGSPGSAVGTCEGYVSWTDDRDPGSEPSRTGFNFLGWSTNPTVAVEGTGKLDTLSIPKGTQPAEGEDGAKSITLYALWAPINYSVAFDLTKNPEDASATPSFNWTTGKGTFSDLGGGRYRLSGVTLEDYDPSTGLIEISTPSRGTGGYRFLSWAEPDEQQDPTIAVKKPGSSKWYVNPVALPHYDYEPVLTARWSLSFDVDVPSQVTFDEYDSLEVEGNLTDTTDKQDIDEESPDAHDAGKKAHFCSQSTATDYKIVALRSVRQPTASDILTSSDTVSEGGKYTQDYVLGSERLLSLFAEGATAESQGVHFKLDDDVDMDDSTRYGSFVIPKQAAPFDPTATERDDENRLYVSYRLNLSNKVGDSETPNHGLVTPGGVSEGDRTPIAEVSYEFAVADGLVATEKGIVHQNHRSATGSTAESFFIEHNNKVYGLNDIKGAADCISLFGEDSPCYELYHGFLTNDVQATVKWGDGLSYPVRIIGINHDGRSDGAGKAGLTFQFVNLLNQAYYVNYPTCNTDAHYGTTTNVFNGDSFTYQCHDTVRVNQWEHDTARGGWGSSLLRARMNPGVASDEALNVGSKGRDDNAIWNQVPPNLAKKIVPVSKGFRANLLEGSSITDLPLQHSDDYLFLTSYFEIASPPYDSYVSNKLGDEVLYEFWRAQGIKGNAENPGTAAVKYRQLQSGVASSPWEWISRTTSYASNGTFPSIISVREPGSPYHGVCPSGVLGICPAFCL